MIESFQGEMGRARRRNHMQEPNAAKLLYLYKPCTDYLITDDGSVQDETRRVILRAVPPASPLHSGRWPMATIVTRPAANQADTMMLLVHKPRPIGNMLGHPRSPIRLHHGMMAALQRTS